MSWFGVEAHRSDQNRFGFSHTLLLFMLYQKWENRDDIKQHRTICVVITPIPTPKFSLNNIGSFSECALIIHNPHLYILQYIGSSPHLPKLLVGQKRGWLCQETGLEPIWTLQLSNSPPTYTHTLSSHTPDKHTMTSLVRGGSGFYLLIWAVWGEPQTCSVCQRDPGVSRRRGLTLQFLPPCQPNSSSSENTHWERGSCTWVLLQHSNIFCLLTLSDPVKSRAGGSVLQCFSSLELKV